MYYLLIVIPGNLFSAFCNVIVDWVSDGFLVPSGVGAVNPALDKLSPAWFLQHFNEQVCFLYQRCAFFCISDASEREITSEPPKKSKSYFL